MCTDVHCAGEMFRCWWSQPEVGAEEATQAALGPVPWCQPSDLVFLGEQVGTIHSVSTP